MLIEVTGDRISLRFTMQPQPKYVAVRPHDYSRHAFTRKVDTHVDFTELKPLTLYDIILYDDSIVNPTWQTQLRTCAAPTDCLRLSLTETGRLVEQQPVEWNNQPADPNAPTGGLTFKSHDELANLDFAEVEKRVMAHLALPPQEGMSSTVYWSGEVPRWLPLSDYYAAATGADDRGVWTGVDLGAGPSKMDYASAPPPSYWNTPIKHGAVWPAEAPKPEPWYQKYEYHILEHFGGWTTSQLLEELNALGTQGWEMVSKDDARIIFKREVDG